MTYKFNEVAKAELQLKQTFKSLSEKRQILRDPALKQLMQSIKDIPQSKRADYGKEVNNLKQIIEGWVVDQGETSDSKSQIDITAPFDQNVAVDKRPRLLSAQDGSIHPLMEEMSRVTDIMSRMGFDIEESREVDDDYHMFESLNFPAGHPARDDYDTFMTTEGLIAPAHTSTMQNRVLRKYKDNLSNGGSIAVAIPGRVFRNEDLDARHEHTFYQLEGVYVGKGINAGHLIATLKTFLQEYYNQELEIKTQPFYFPFTEPSFEITLSCPFCQKKGCNICGRAGWIELLGCGMIHPNVLKMADIEPSEYTGFAWGVGIDRLVMMKHNVEDIRHFHSGKLEFLRQFK